MTLAMEYNLQDRDIVRIYKDEVLIQWYVVVIHGERAKLYPCFCCEQALDLFDETVSRLRMEVN